MKGEMRREREREGGREGEREGGREGLSPRWWRLYVCQREGVCVCVIVSIAYGICTPAHTQVIKDVTKVIDVIGTITYARTHAHARTHTHAHTHTGDQGSAQGD